MSVSCDEVYVRVSSCPSLFSLISKFAQKIATLLVYIINNCVVQQSVVNYSSASELSCRTPVSLTAVMDSLAAEGSRFSVVQATSDCKSCLGSRAGLQRHSRQQEIAH
jgi:hypothetical protein